MTAIDKGLVDDREYTKAVKKKDRKQGSELFNITLSTTTSTQA